MKFDIEEFLKKYQKRIKKDRKDFQKVLCSKDQRMFLRIWIDKKGNLLECVGLNRFDKDTICTDDFNMIYESKKGNYLWEVEAKELYCISSEGNIDTIIEKIVPASGVVYTPKKYIGRIVTVVVLPKKGEEDECQWKYQIGKMKGRATNAFQRRILKNASAGVLKVRKQMGKDIILVIS